MTTIIFNSKDKEQKRFTKATAKLAFSVLSRIQGRTGWWAKIEYDDGDSEVFHYVNGKWVN